MDTVRGLYIDPPYRTVSPYPGSPYPYRIRTVSSVSEFNLKFMSAKQSAPKRRDSDRIARDATAH